MNPDLSSYGNRGMTASRRVLPLLWVFMRLLSAACRLTAISLRPLCGGRYAAVQTSSRTRLPALPPGDPVGKALLEQLS